MKNISIIILAIITSIFSYSCSNDEIDKQTIIPDPIEASTTSFTLKGEVRVSEAIKTKAALIETMDGAKQVLRFEWEVGDKIQLGFVQEGKDPQTIVANVTDITSDKRTANFSVAIPEEIDGNFTLFAYYGAGSLDQSNPANIILPDAQEFAGTLTDQVRLLSMWDKKDMIFDGETLPEISINFKHLGSIMSLHVKNINSIAINDIAQIVLGGTNNWLFNESTNAIFDMSSASFSVDSKGEGSNMSIKIGETINAGETKTFHSWFVPGDFEEGLQLGLLAKNTDLEERGQSNVKITPNGAFETGINYGLNIDIDGNNIEFAGFTPRIVLTTNKQIGDSIQLRVATTDNHKTNVWIDLNNNGVREEGEDPLSFGTSSANLHKYKINSQTITVYGEFSYRFECSNSELISIDLSKNPALSAPLYLQDNSLSELDISNNLNIHTVYIQRNKVLSSMNISPYSKLKYLNVESNQLSTEAINSIYNQLPDWTGTTTNPSMYLRSNPGSGSADHIIAENKKWALTHSW